MVNELFSDSTDWAHPYASNKVPEVTVTDLNKVAETGMDQIQERQTEHGGKIEPSICPFLC